jgi:hypothetical protein
MMSLFYNNTTRLLTIGALFYNNTARLVSDDIIILQQYDKTANYWSNITESRHKAHNNKHRFVQQNCAITAHYHNITV